MSLPSARLLAGPSSHNASVQAWILAVSNHPLSLDYPMSLPAPVTSDDEDTSGSRPRSSTITRAKKRSRADSSPIASRYRVFADPNEEEILPSPAISRDPTPAETEVEVSSAMSNASSTFGNTLKNSRRKNTTTKRANGDPEKELAECIARIKKTPVAVYTSFEYPFIVYNDDQSITHYGFKCKACDRVTRRQVGVSTTSGLLGHLRTCASSIKQQQILGGFGITGGNTSHLTPEQVRESFALWTAESARPFCIVNDRHLQKLLHPDARIHRPHRDTISKDIRRIYQATQNDIKKVLAAHSGVFHVALDLFQSGNGYDFLGIVIFRYLAASSPLPASRKITVERFVLECLNYSEAHTGVELAKVLHSVLVKFKIENQVWGVVCDNASNNAAMMNELGKYRMKRLTGTKARVHCVLHVLNLVAVAIAAPFRARRRDLIKEHGCGDSDEEDEVDKAEEQSTAGKDHIQADEADETDEDDDGLDPSMMLDLDDDETDAEEDDENEDAEDKGAEEKDADGKEADAEEAEEDGHVEIKLPKMVKGSAEDLEQARAAMVLFKVSRLAHRIRFTPKAKVIFRKSCVEKKVKTPHNVQRDNKTRWNSSEVMLRDCDRTWDGGIEFQTTTRYTPRELLLRKDDRKTIQGLLKVLTPLSVVTKILSHAGVPMMADVIVHYDGLNCEYSEMCVDPNLPLWMRLAANRGRQVLNKYYEKTDESELYRLAMLLHPSMRIHYFKAAGWEKDWIDTAVEIAEKCWTTHYKAAVSEPVVASEPSQFSYSKGYLGKVYASIGAARATSVCPVKAFVEAEPLIKHGENGEPTMLDPLAWWYGQRCAGNEYLGLTQMALDVLSTPASSVDVERAFSFAGSIVSKRRHNLAPATIEATASLGSYSKAGLVRPGILVLPLKGKAAAKEAKAKATTKAK